MHVVSNSFLCIAYSETTDWTEQVYEVLRILKNIKVEVISSRIRID